MVPWQHPFYTAFTGIGLAVARMNKNMFVKILAVPTGYLCAVVAHSIHNSFGALIGGIEGFALSTLFDWTSWFVMLLFIFFMIGRERAVVQKQLADEVSAGVISPAQYRRAVSPFTMSTAFLTGGRAAVRFYQACGELAHKKEQLQKLGEENGTSVIIQALRNQLVTLGPLVKA